MKVFFVSLIGLENECYLRISKDYHKYGFDCSFISLSKRGHLDSIEKGVNAYYMPDLLDEVGNIECNEKIIREIEADFNLVNFRGLYFSDRYLTGNEETKALKTLKYIYAWENLFKKDKPDCIVTDVGGELIRRTVYFVAKKHNIHIRILNWVPLPKNLSLSGNEFYQLEPVKINETEEIPPQEREVIQKHINWVINRSKPFSFNPSLSITSKRVKNFIRDSYDSFFIEKSKNEHLIKRKHLALFLKRKINYLLNKSLYKKPDYNEKYIFLPLHGWDDFQLTVRARHCLDQKYIVKLCSEAIPYGYKLYVKEHPGFIGYANKAFLREITSLKNVVLLWPSISPYEIIKNSQAVLTINSTAGYEALLYSKPVITLGYSFYSNYGLTVDVANFFELGHAIKKGLDFKVDKEKLCKFIYSTMKTTYEAEYWTDGSEENMQKLSKGILNKLQQVRNNIKM